MNIKWCLVFIFFLIRSASAATENTNSTNSDALPTKRIIDVPPLISRCPEGQKLTRCKAGLCCRNVTSILPAEENSRVLDASPATPKISEGRKIQTIKCEGGQTLANCSEGLCCRNVTIITAWKRSSKSSFITRCPEGLRLRRCGSGICCEDIKEQKSSIPDASPTTSKISEGHKRVINVPTISKCEGGQKLTRCKDGLCCRNITKFKAELKSSVPDASPTTPIFDGYKRMINVPNIFKCEGGQKLTRCKEGLCCRNITKFKGS